MILVVYDSPSGATEDIAHRIGERLATRGLEAELLRVREVESLEGVNVVIAGSPVINADPTGEFLTFLDRFARDLQKISTVYFCSCLKLVRDLDAPSGAAVFVEAALDDPPRRIPRFGVWTRRHSLSRYLEPFALRDLLDSAICVAFFRGRLRLSGLDPVTRAVMRVLGAVAREFREGDYIDGDAIDRWVDGLSL